MCTYSSATVAPNGMCTYSSATVAPTQTNPPKNYKIASILRRAFASSPLSSSQGTITQRGAKHTQSSTKDTGPTHRRKSGPRNAFTSCMAQPAGADTSPTKTPSCRNPYLSPAPSDSSDTDLTSPAPVDYSNPIIISKNIKVYLPRD